MNTDAPHPQLLRGLQLKELGRYTDAESAFKEALAQEPNDAFALHQLAGCQWQIPGRHKDALQTINQAIAVEPNESEHHVLRAFILCVLDRPKEALSTARTALGLTPNESAAYTAEAQAHLQMENWPAAEQSARRALALDADNSGAANQLAQALRLQNKQAENDAHLAGMLARDPDDAFTHANAGWSALNRGEHRVAETHFREALRIDPDFDYAREGLLNSFRARSPIYRAYLKYCFAMQRLSSGARWAVILGLYFGVKVARYIPGGFILVALYFLFVLWVWVARGVGNFILLFDRFARFALRRNEKIEALAVGGGLCVGLVLLGVGVLWSPSLLVIGLGLVAAVFPLSMTFTNASRLGVWLFGSIAAVTLVGALLSGFSSLLPILEPTFMLFAIGAFGCLASTWLGNLRIFNRR
jgi:Tfp pilus assembly protein PilF